MEFGLRWKSGKKANTLNCFETIALRTTARDQWFSLAFPCNEDNLLQPSPPQEPMDVLLERSQAIL